ncbi:ferredoxin, 2Fe-2S [Filimonas lacunae]|uniref:Ferredoxin, 2Fe-2S n=1 Tax=Filimonas lacunae TaxID=477680 RepID=A0A173MM81_9BACT|nr:2Fe-2S iron-sulfur cluster-binding protein [Filimonas lacunae]BAV08742.1 ferredoxin, 2fe-2S [Filimonas lacunae]SIS60969.1 ferredoxin, 2Fe-2S [Filimonas lacunae]
MMINITVENRDGERRNLEIPDDMNLSLMEALKAYEYNILATCGGMALCATCHVQVLQGLPGLPPMKDAEMDMLDTLPDAASDSRLACQLRVDETMEGAIFKIMGEEE